VEGAPLEALFPLLSSTSISAFALFLLNFFSLFFTSFFLDAELSCSITVLDLRLLFLSFSSIKLFVLGTKERVFFAIRYSGGTASTVILLTLPPYFFL
jgi:hypothetical protein